MGLGIGLGIGLNARRLAFSPNRDSNLKLWLRADLGFDGTGWADQSGTGKKFVPGVLPTLVSSGINGRPALAGNGTSTTLTCASFVMPSEPFTIYVVGQLASQASVRAFLSDGGGNAAIYANASTTMAAFASPDQLTITFNGTQAAIYRAVFNGATSSFRASPGNVSQSGAQPATWPGTSGLTLFSFPGTDFLDKWLSEVVVVSGSGDSQIEAYLSGRYGIVSP